MYTDTCPLATARSTAGGTQGHLDLECAHYRRLQQGEPQTTTEPPDIHAVIYIYSQKQH